MNHENKITLCFINYLVFYGLFDVLAELLLKAK